MRLKCVTNQMSSEHADRSVASQFEAWNDNENAVIQISVNMFHFIHAPKRRFFENLFPYI